MDHESAFPPFEHQSDYDIALREYYQQRQAEVLVLGRERTPQDAELRNKYILSVATNSARHALDFLFEIQRSDGIADKVRDEALVPGHQLGTYAMTSTIAALTVYEEAEARLANYRSFATRFIDDPAELTKSLEKLGCSSSYSAEMLSASMESQLAERDPSGLPHADMKLLISAHARNNVIAQDYSEAKWLSNFKNIPTVRSGVYERLSMDRSLIGRLLGRVAL